MAGMYRLLGHDQPQVRQLAGDMCKAFGVIETVDEFDEVSGLGALLDEWVRAALSTWHACAINHQLITPYGRP